MSHVLVTKNFQNKLIMFEFCVGHDFIEKNSHLSYKKDSFHLVNEIPTQVRMSCHIGMPFDIYIFNSRRHELFPNFINSQSSMPFVVSFYEELVCAHREPSQQYSCVKLNRTNSRVRLISHLILLTDWVVAQGFHH